MASGSRKVSVVFAEARRSEGFIYRIGRRYNTPGIIKYPFWQMTNIWPQAEYICLNYGDAYAPTKIKKKSLCINGDIGEILERC